MSESARTVAPPSISRDAEILVLGQKNFETAVQGKNGFVCVVGRVFAGPLSNPDSPLRLLLEDIKNVDHP